MKTRTLLLAALLALPFAAVASPPPAAGILASAEAKAKQSHRNVLLIFHASWCGWCHRLDEMLESPQVGPTLAKAYVVAHVVVNEAKDKVSLENGGGKEQMATFGGAQAGLPFFVVLSPDGKVLATSIPPGGSNIGFPSEPGEVTYFMSLLGTTAPNLSPEDRMKVEYYLQHPAKKPASHPG